MSSVQSEMTPAALAVQVRLERAVHSGTFLLTEGWSDSHFFKQLVDVSACNVTTCIGRESVLAVISILEEDRFSGVLGVVDADFSMFTGEEIDSCNVCVTDENDIECMIVASSAWDKVLLEYGSTSKIKEIEASHERSVKALILEQVALIGSIRISAKVNDWPLHFSGMKYRFRSNTALWVEQERVVEHVIGRSNLSFKLTVAEVLTEARLHIESTADDLRLCSGHDICRVMARALKKWAGTYNGFEADKSLKDLGRVLRVSYERTDFLSSGLYRCMLGWEKRNHPFRIF